MECKIDAHFNYNSLTREEIEKTLINNNLNNGFVYKKIYYEFIDPYPYVLNHPIPLNRIWYYILYFILLFFSFFKTFIASPIKTGLNFLKKKTTTQGVEKNPDVCSMDPENNEIIDFEKNKNPKEIIIKTESFYFNHQKSLHILKELIDSKFKIPFKNKLSEFFRIKLRIEYILNPTENKKNDIKILYTFPKTIIDILNFEENIKRKIKKCYNPFKNFLKENFKIKKIS